MKRKKSWIICLLLLFTVGMLAGCKSEEETSEALLKAFVAENQTAIDAMIEANKDKMEITVTTEGNVWKYTYKILLEMGESEAAKANLDIQMLEQEAQIQETVEVLREAGVKDPVIVLEYFDKDGEEMARYEFK